MEGEEKNPNQKTSLDLWFNNIRSMKNNLDLEL
jgi:hypothetical protein